MGKPFRSLRSPKKIYFRDPFTFHALRAWALGYQEPYRAEEAFLQSPENVGYLVEGLVASSLERRWGKAVFYWRNGGEIDFVAGGDSQENLLIEVKYQGRVSMENAKALKKWGGGILLTRETLALHGKVLFVPLSSFLALL
jgi:predicted AAA+ superfamily ATPase